MYDHNINEASNFGGDEFEASRLYKTKKVKRVEQGFCAKAKKGAEIPVGSLHFQGAAKIYIESFARNGNTFDTTLSRSIPKKAWVRLRQILSGMYKRLR
jgi:hypothetical protein